jgi:hypothetical protein
MIYTVKIPCAMAASVFLMIYSDSNIYIKIGSINLSKQYTHLHMIISNHVKYQGILNVGRIAIAIFKKDNNSFKHSPIIL